MWMWLTGQPVSFLCLSRINLLCRTWNFEMSSKWHSIWKKFDATVIYDLVYCCYYLLPLSVYLRLEVYLRLICCFIYLWLIKLFMWVLVSQSQHNLISASSIRSCGNGSGGPPNGVLIDNISRTAKTMRLLGVCKRGCERERERETEREGRLSERYCRLIYAERQREQTDWESNPLAICRCSQDVSWLNHRRQPGTDGKHATGHPGNRKPPRLLGHCNTWPGHMTGLCQGSAFCCGSQRQVIEEWRDS